MGDSCRREVLADLVAASRRLASLDVDDLDAVLSAVVEEAHRILGERVVLALLDGEQLVCRAAQGDPELVPRDDRVSVRGTLAGIAIRTGEPQLCVDALADRRVDPEHNRRMGIRSSVVVPMIHTGDVLGVLVLLSGVPARFEDTDRDTLALLAFTAAQAVAVAVARCEGRTARAALADSRRMLGAARHVSGAGVWEWDLETGRLGWSDEMYRLCGAAPGSLEPTITLWNSLIHPDDRAASAQNRERALADGEGYQQHFRIVGLDGAVRHLHTWGHLERAPDGTAARAIGATIDVTDLARLSRSDPLTGLFNRAVLDEQLSAALAALGSREPSRQVALLLCDLDRFKLVNETQGHRAGDALLAQVAARLMTTCPAGSLVARLGGDEFAVLLPQVTGLDDALTVAHRVLEACRQPVHLAGGVEVLVTTTVGIAMAASADRDPGQVFREVDLALYRAKEAGRDRLAVFDEPMRAAVEGRVRTEGALRSAIEAERLVVVYQPVVSLRTGAVVGVEALARVVDVELGPVSLATFVGAAEETGLIVAVDQWVLRQGLRLAARWRPPGHREDDPLPPQVAVNFSTRTLERCEVADVVARVLAETGASGEQLLLEITEHSLLNRGREVRRALRNLSRLGVGVGMDDFGTGWSAMAYLTGLHLRFLKIDRSFVLRIAERDERAEAVVQAIIDLAHAHGLVVTAEGVETERQAQCLRDMGCDQAQGWWFGRPVPEAQLDEAVRTWNARAEALPWARWGRRPQRQRAVSVGPSTR